MRTGIYILEGHDPVAMADIVAWAQWFETADRCVAHDIVDGVRVSTVFLGTDHSFGFGDRPLLFETMVFGEGGDAIDDATTRYATWDEALSGHAIALARVHAMGQVSESEGTKTP